MLGLAAALIYGPAGAGSQVGPQAKIAVNVCVPKSIAYFRAPLKQFKQFKDRLPWQQLPATALNSLQQKKKGKHQKGETKIKPNFLIALLY